MFPFLLTFSLETAQYGCNFVDLAIMHQSFEAYVSPTYRVGLGIGDVQDNGVLTLPAKRIISVLFELIAVLEKYCTIPKN